MIERVHLGIFGRMNVGKSTLMNLLTEQETSIVDLHPGTTADVKTSLLELHKIGPIKIFDTPGVDEEGLLGKKKREKALQVVKEVDYVLLVVPSLSDYGPFEKSILLLAKERKKEIFVIYNLFQEKTPELLFRIEHMHSTLGENLPSIILHLQKDREQLIAFLESHCFKRKSRPFLPFLPENSSVFLNIPMDEETPEGRLLRPQAEVQEYLLRNHISTFVYRMDVQKGRSTQQEKQRFLRHFLSLKKELPLSLLITDSQAIDLVHPWTLSEEGKPLIALTTFSIIMAHKQSGRNLSWMIEGVETLKQLKKGDRILIAEGCNHNRIKEDIGTVQLPRKIEERYGKGSIHIEHAFGRELSAYDFSSYRLVIHCGGCMLDAQKVQARVEDFIALRVPFTNYGMALAYFHSPTAFSRVIDLWKR